MPKIKVDRIVSFSTEDFTHEARNVLSTDPSKKWKCQKEGEKDANIVLQLEQASNISSIDIGNEHSAYVEVLVTRSSSTDDYKVLLVMSSFMSPLESRQSTNPNKVRMFSYNDLQNPERDQKWDRVKIVCTQPFNRRVQYGLSFITLHAREGKENANSSAPVKLGKFSLRPDSPDHLSSGSLFARRKELAEDTPVSAAAAIRGAFLSPASADSPKCKPRLKEATITPWKKQVPVNDDLNTRARNRNELLYNKDEEEVHDKIDKVIEQKNKEAQEKRAKEEEKMKNEKKQKKIDKKADQLDKNKHKNNTKPDTPSNKVPSSSNRQEPSTSKRKIDESTSHTSSKKQKSDRPTKPFNKLLDGVVVVISGIQNPERATIRSNALEMGAKYKPDWDGSSTHLICAFTNTPKYNQVKGKGKIINRLWIPDCHSQRKKLPWRRYALDVKEQSGNDSEEEIWEAKPERPLEIEVLFSRVNGDNDDDTDTEDEIDRIEALQKTTKKVSHSSFSADTDEESIKPQSKNAPPELPNFLAEKTVYIDENFSEKSRSILSRYITSFNGTLVNVPSDAVNYAISLPQTAQILKDICLGAHVVKPDWVWECHNTKQLLPTDDYEL